MRGVSWRGDVDTPSGFAVKLRTLFQVLLVAGAALPAVADDYRATIGLTTLRSQGYLRGNGKDITIGQVEAPESATRKYYAPDSRNFEFKGKDFELEGIPSTPSAHATRIGSLIYGNSSGIAPEVDEVYSYSSESFVGSEGLNAGSGKKPEKLDADVINNSWVGTFGNLTQDVSALRRLDYMAWRDDVVVVNSTENESWKPFPTLLASSYNGITVGRSIGSSGGVVTTDGGVRVKPDLIAPLPTTSDAAAVVSGAAALLLSEADARKMKPDALSIKAMLMAGALRPPGWQHGTSSTADDRLVPMDHKYGAGELRVYRSFHILSAGEQKENKLGAKRGWISDKLSGSGKDDYFELRYSDVVTEFTAVLAWHRRFQQRDRSYDNLTPVLADLELELLRKTGNKWVSVAFSDSNSDNVEMIAIDNLAAGTYRLTVGGGKNEAYGLAWDADYNASARRYTPPRAVSIDREGSWNAVAVPEPASLILLPAACLLLARRRDA
jgi:hypothetical protein